MKSVVMNIEIGEDAVCIDEMRAMSIPDYRDYIEDKLLFVDHHDVLRATLGEYPIATSREQVDALIDHLQSVKARMPD